MKKILVWLMVLAMGLVGCAEVPSSSVANA